MSRVEDDTTCCYALQDEVWVHGPGAEPWEVYTVKADAPDAASIHPVGVSPRSGALRVRAAGVLAEAVSRSGVVVA